METVLFRRTGIEKSSVLTPDPSHTSNYFSNKLINNYIDYFRRFLFAHISSREGALVPSSSLWSSQPWVVCNLLSKNLTIFLFILTLSWSKKKKPKKVVVHLKDFSES